MNHFVKGVSSGFIIEGNVDPISRFADKISEFDIKHPNPIDLINNIISLCVILPNLDELKIVQNLIHENFIVIDEIKERKFNESDIVDAAAFHTKYIVKLKTSSEIYKRLGLNLSSKMYDLKAEIQILTFIQYAWIKNFYEYFCKRDFKIPKSYLVELNKNFTLLTIVDNNLNDLIRKLKDYESNYGAYMDHDRIIEEIERLEIINNVDQKNFEIANKISKLAISIENWDKTIEVIENTLKINEWKKEPDLKQANLLKSLGIALYKKHRFNPNTEGFIAGQAHLKAAIKKNPNDSDALASLGGFYKILKSYKESYSYYKKALEVNPGDPYPLVNYLIMKIQKTGKLSSIKHNLERIKRGIEKRLTQIDMMIDLPWAFFDLATFSLFLGKIEDALYYYLNGVRYSTHLWMIETTLNSLDEIKLVQDQILGFDMVRKLLLLGMIFHPYKDVILNQNSFNYALNCLSNLMHIKENKFKEPIVIIAGGTDEFLEKEILKYRDNFIKGFKDFKGTIISGGTNSGVSAIVGDIQKAYPEKIKTIGYVPSHLPYNIEINKNYTTICATEGSNFSISEPLQYWFDILNSKSIPTKIKLIGINGGKISALEFRLAIAFGAQVAIVNNSGHAASELINDKFWTEPIRNETEEKTKKLFRIIENSHEDIMEFLTKPFTTDPDIENLRKFFIHHKSGNLIYEKNFSYINQPGDLLSGLLSAIQSFSAEIGFGEIPVLSAKGGSITMILFNSNDYRAFFFLFKEPSKALAKKIEKVTIICENELSDEFNKLGEIKPYRSEDKIANIFSRVFGTEILKFFSI